MTHRFARTAIVPTTAAYVGARLTALFALLLLLTSPALAQSFEDGQAAAQRGNPR